MPPEWVRDLSLSFPITTHSLSILQHFSPSVMIAFPLLDHKLFMVRVQALFLSTTNKAPQDLSSANLISQKASNKPPLLCPLSLATILFSIHSAPVGFYVVYTITHLVLTSALRHRAYYDPHCTHEDTEAQRG